MKKVSFFFLGMMALSLVFIYSCKKDSHGGLAANPFVSLSSFYSHFGVKMQYYTVNAAAGGSFTSAKGTTVTIPANAFQTQSGGAVSGTVTIAFKDIYSKSDMLLSDMATNQYWGPPLKSGGEFFIKASQGGVALEMASGKSITVEQPLQGLPLDTAMAAFVAVPDTFNNNMNWIPTSGGSVAASASGYVFSLYSFSMPVDSGSWCNSDNSSYFAAYPQTQLTLHSNETPGEYYTDVFLVFSGVNAMVHVYESWGSQGNFPYNYAPTGLQCTVVAIGVKDNKLFSSFTPITIGTNQTVNFNFTETTAEDFKAAVEALN